MPRLPTRLFALAAATLAAPAMATENFLVTRFDDPAPDACVPGDCSLREAAMAASANPDYDAITLPAGTFNVGAPAIACNGGVRLYGAGVDQTFVVGDGSADLFTFDGVQQMSMEEMSLDATGQREIVATNTNAFYLYRIAAPNPLGAIEVEQEGDAGFGIGDSTILARVSCAGGDHCFYYDSTFVYVSKPGASPFGGGSVDVTFENVVVDGALAPGADSGIFVSSSSLLSLDRVTVRDSTLGIYVTDIPFGFGSPVDIARLTYEGNARPLRLNQRSDIEIVDSVFRDNRHDDPADPRPGAVWISGIYADATIHRSSFIDNRGSALAGGAVLVDDDAQLRIENATFSGNSFSAAAATQAGGVRGGAVGIIGSDNGDPTTLILGHVTIVAPGGVQPVGIHGSAIGGWGADGDSSVVTINSIIAGTCSFEDGGLDLANGNVERGTSCGLSGDNLVDVSDAQLALGTLALHGGATPTYLPSPASVVIDAGNASYGLDEDQRAYARPLGAAPDAGAVETGDVIFADRFE